MPLLTCGITDALTRSVKQNAPRSGILHSGFSHIYLLGNMAREPPGFRGETLKGKPAVISVANGRAVIFHFERKGEAAPEISPWQTGWGRRVGVGGVENQYERHPEFNSEPSGGRSGRVQPPGAGTKARHRKRGVFLLL